MSASMLANSGLGAPAASSEAAARLRICPRAVSTTPIALWPPRLKVASFMCWSLLNGLRVSGVADDTSRCPTPDTRLLLDDRYRSRPAGRGGFDLHGEAGDFEAGG